jgi:hypothetical protein
VGLIAPPRKDNMTIKLEANKTVEDVFNNYHDVFIENNLVRWNVAKQDGLTHYPFEDMLNDFYNCDLISKTVRDATVKAKEEEDDLFWDNYFGGKI